MQGLQGNQELKDFRVFRTKVFKVYKAGNQGLQGLQGNQGVQGLQGMSNQGVQGLQGLQGRQGTQGLTGAFGGATFEYTFSTNTVDSDPGAGTLKFDNSNLSSATLLYIDDSEGGATPTDIQTYLRTIDDSTSGIKGHFKVSNVSNPDDFAMFAITGSITEATDTSSSCFLYLVVQLPLVTRMLYYFARTGDKGDTGSQGTQGLQGLKGNQGVQGLWVTKVFKVYRVQR